MTLAPATIPSPGSAHGPRRLRVLLYLLVAGLAFAFVWSSRSQLPDAGRALAHARPGFVVLLSALSGLYLFAYAGLTWSSMRATGFDLPIRRVAVLSGAAHFYNMVAVNSGGLGGVPLYVREARRRGVSPGAAITGSLVVSLLGHLVFAVVLAVALAAALMSGELTRIEILAASIFAVYTVASACVVAAALKNEAAFSRVYGIPSRVFLAVVRRLRSQATTASGVRDSDGAADMYAAVQLLRRSARSFVAPLAFAAIIEVVGVLMVWTALLAFGSPAGIVTALIAYSAGVLLSTVGFLPAGLGFAELGMGVALAAAGLDGAHVAVVVVTYRIFEVWVPFGLGAVCAHRLAVRGDRVRTTAPGIAGRSVRRLASAAVLLLGAFNVFLAARRHPLIRLGPFHQLIPHAAVQSSRYLLLASGMALLGSAAGLLHGKRQAWLICVLALCGALAAHPFKRVDYVGIAANAGVLALLLTLAPAFPARSDPVRARQGVAWLVLGELGVLAYGVAGLYLLDRHFAGNSSFIDSVEDGVRLLFVLPSTTIEPTTRHGAWFVDSVRVAAMAVLVISAYHLLHPVVLKRSTAREEQRLVAGLLERYAETSLAFFHLLPDKSYFLADDGEAFIGYRVVGHSAVALGEPIGAPAARRQVVREFAQFCDLNGWSFCFHQVTEAGAAELADEGLRVLKIGEEAVIPLDEFSLSGKSFKHIRNALNRLDRDGYGVERHMPGIEQALLDELEEVSNDWLHASGHRERAFTLGAFSREYLRTSQIFLVRAQSGRIEAFANIIPSYRSPDGNFDLMRRRPDAADGVMDLLFVALVDHFKTSGFEGMNLGFAPLSNISGSGVPALALRLLYSRGSSAFNFQGLRAFKEKWKPNWQPRYLVYRSDLQLPALALAVARAGERSGKVPISLRFRPFQHGEGRAVAAT